MKAEKTRILVDSLLGRIITPENYTKTFAIIQAKLNDFNKEIEELERLAQIGFMVESLIEKELVFKNWQSLSHIKEIYDKNKNKCEHEYENITTFGDRKLNKIILKCSLCGNKKTTKGRL